MRSGVVRERAICPLYVEGIIETRGAKHMVMVKKTNEQLKMGKPERRLEVLFWNQSGNRSWF